MHQQRIAAGVASARHKTAAIWVAASILGTLAAFVWLSPYIRVGGPNVFHFILVLVCARVIAVSAGSLIVGVIATVVTFRHVGVDPDDETAIRAEIMDASRQQKERSRNVPLRMRFAFMASVVTPCILADTERFPSWFVIGTAVSIVILRILFLLPKQKPA